MKPQLDGLLIDPCLPAALPRVSIRRIFRGNTYEIDVENRSGGEKHRVSLTVDGAPLDGQLIPAPEGTGRTFRVQVTVE